MLWKQRKCCIEKMNECYLNSVLFYFFLLFFLVVHFYYSKLIHFETLMEAQQSCILPALIVVFFFYALFLYLVTTACAESVRFLIASSILVLYLPFYILSVLISFSTSSSKFPFLYSFLLLTSCRTTRLFFFSYHPRKLILLNELQSPFVKWSHPPSTSHLLRYLFPLKLKALLHSQWCLHHVTMAISRKLHLVFVLTLFLISFTSTYL